MTQRTTHKVPAQYDYDEIVRCRSGERGKEMKIWDAITDNLVANPNQRHRSQVAKFYKEETLRRKAETVGGSAKLSSSKTKRRHKAEVISSSNDNALSYSKLPDEPYIMPEKWHNEPDRTDTKAYTEFVIQWLFKYFGDFFKWDPVPEYTREMIEITLFETFVVLLEPRDHGKTFVKIGVYLFKTIHWRVPMLVITSTIPAQKRIYNAYEYVINSPLVVNDYGKLMYSKPNRKDFDVWFFNQGKLGVIDAFFRVASLRGGYVGSHCEHTDLEDVLQNMPVSDEAVINFMKNFDTNVLDLSEQLSISGTRKDIVDFYSMVKERGFKHIIRKAIIFHSTKTYPTEEDWDFELDLDGNPDLVLPIELKQEYLDQVEYTLLGCPNYNFLRLMKRFWRDPDSFFSQMQNDPVPKEGDFFKSDWWIEIPPYTDGRLNNKIISVTDPAFGKTFHSSDTCTITGCYYNNKFIITEIIIGKYPKGKLEDMLYSVQEDQETVNDYIENDYSQIDSRYDETNELYSELKINTFNNKGFGDKFARIETSIKKARRKQILIYMTAKNKKKAKNQWLQYNGKKGKWDFLDCLASFCRIVQFGIKSNKKLGMSYQRI